MYFESLSNTGATSQGKSISPRLFTRSPQKRENFLHSAKDFRPKRTAIFSSPQRRWSQSASTRELAPKSVCN